MHTGGSHNVYATASIAKASSHGLKQNRLNGLDFKTGATSIDSLGNESSYTGNQTYNTARTPYIQSQLSNNARYNLFRLYSRSHGDDINSRMKVAILNIKRAEDVPGSEYGTFSVQVRVHNPNGLDDDNILEQFDALTFDLKSPNYFAKRIGDRHVTIDSNGKLTYYGDYPNLSKHIRVGDFTKTDDNLGQYPASLVPMGHAALNNTVPGTTTVPSASFKVNQNNNQGTFDSNVFFLFDFID